MLNWARCYNIVSFGDQINEPKIYKSTLECKVSFDTYVKVQDVKTIYLPYIEHRPLHLQSYPLRAKIISKF